MARFQPITFQQLSRKYNSGLPTLSEIVVRADWNVDVVESGRLRRRKIRVSTLTLFDHVALVTCFLTYLGEQCTKAGQFVYCVTDNVVQTRCLSFVNVVVTDHGGEYMTITVPLSVHQLLIFEPEND